MNKQRLLNWFLIIVIAALLIYLIIFTKSSSSQCLTNPGAYQIKLLEKANNSSVSCSCNSFSNKGSFSFSLTSKGIELIKPGTYNINKLPSILR